MTEGRDPEPAGSPAAPRPRFQLSDHRILLADLALIVITGLALAGIVPRQPIWTLSLVLAAVSTVGWIVMVRVRNRMRFYASALGSAEMRTVDAAFALVPPNVAPMLDDLARLGFRVVGVTDTTVAGRPDFRSWILVEPSGETWIEVGDAGRAIAVLLSGTAAGRQVESAWPTGMSIDAPELLAAPASETLELTLADHRTRVASERRAEEAVDGAPLDPARPDGWRIRTFDDYLAWEPTQRKRTGGLRLKTDLRRRIEPAIRQWGISTAVSLACGVVLSAFA